MEKDGKQHASRAITKQPKDMLSTPQSQGKAIKQAQTVLANDQPVPSDDFATTMLGYLTEIKTLFQNSWKSNNAIFAARNKSCVALMNTLEKKLLEKKTYTNAEEQEIMNMLMELQRRMDRKDTENKAFQLIMTGIASFAAYKGLKYIVKSFTR